VQEQGGGAERGKERISSRLLPSVEPDVGLDAGLDLRTPRSRPELKSKSWMPNPLSHPGIPANTIMF